LIVSIGELLAVLMSVYNVGSLLKEAVESIRRQTFSN